MAVGRVPQLPDAIVFKKAFKIILTFGLLVAGYAGYARVFAIVAERLGRDFDGESTPFPETESKSAIRAAELARETLGAGSFASRRPKIVHYDQARGYYLYADNYERLDDGKRIRIWPFAMVWASKDGKSRKTATSKEAIIDLSQPFGIVKVGSGPSRVVHARMSGDVNLRDDKGTRDDPSDDLRVGPMASLEYDEKTLQITTDSEVFLQDRDLTMTGVRMMIQLRRAAAKPGEAPSAAGVGFDAETAYLYENVHIVVKNVGSNGILPGTARPEKGGQTPLDLRADGEMRIDLPRPHPVVLIGPPDLNRAPDPTLVKFMTNVRVTRGTDKLDQMNSDFLDLTLMPGGKPDARPTAEVAAIDGKPATPAAKSGSSGPLTDLKLWLAVARGHAVWIQSESQGMKAKCLELRYQKANEPGVPDKTYLFGGPSKLWVEKVEYDTKAADPSTIKSVLNLYSMDATIFDGGSGGTSEVIARGPGHVEDRPARGASVTHTAYWEDEMKMLTCAMARPCPPPGQRPIPPGMARSAA